jgi:hypothetical protein
LYGIADEQRREGSVETVRDPTAVGSVRRTLRAAESRVVIKFSGGGQLRGRVRPQSVENGNGLAGSAIGAVSMRGRRIP